MTRDEETHASAFWAAALGAAGAVAFVVIPTMGDDAPSWLIYAALASLCGAVVFLGLGALLRATHAGRRAKRNARRVLAVAPDGVVCDVDGTLTDGALRATEDGAVARDFSTKDGLGQKALVAGGVPVAWLTATSRGEATRTRARMLGMPDELVVVDPGPKGERFEALCRAMGLDPARVAFLGDDANDLPAMRLAGLAACPADAHPSVREACPVVLNARGGEGALRELADLVLRARDGGGA